MEENQERKMHRDVPKTYGICGGKTPRYGNQRSKIFQKSGRAQLSSSLKGNFSVFRLAPSLVAACSGYIVAWIFGQTTHPMSHNHPVLVIVDRCNPCNSIFSAKLNLTLLKNV